MTNIKDKKKIFQAINFGFYFFVFMMTESEVNKRIEEFNPNNVNLIYAIGLLCTALGYYSFACLKNIIKVDRFRKITMIIIGIGAYISTMLMLFSNIYIIVYFCAFFALFLLGNIGAYAHFSMANVYAEDNNLGKCVGFSCAIAIFIQFFLQNYIKGNIVISLSMLIVTILFVYMGLVSENYWIIDSDTDSNIKKRENTNWILLFCIAVVCMSIVLGLNDNLMVSKNASGEVALFGWVRLFYAIGLIAAGFIADLKGGKYLSFVSSVVIMLSTIAIVLISDSAMYNFNMAIMYFYSGFYVIFFTVKGMKYSLVSNNPRLWSGFGRIVRSVTTGILVLSLLNLNISFLLMAILTSIFTIINVAVCYMLDNSQDMSDNRVYNDNSSNNEKEEFAIKYNLTPRETEVLELLLTTEDTNQEMADKLFISRRVLQRYIASIYEKTGTKTRVGLLQLYSKR